MFYAICKFGIALHSLGKSVEVNVPLLSFRPILNRRKENKPYEEFLSVLFSKTK
jgi:hypothetical protein